MCKRTLHRKSKISATQFNPANKETMPSSSRSRKLQWIKGSKRNSLWGPTVHGELKKKGHERKRRIQKGKSERGEGSRAIVSAPRTQRSQTGAISQPKRRNDAHPTTAFCTAVSTTAFLAYGKSNMDGCLSCHNNQEKKRVFDVSLSLILMSCFKI